MPTSHDHLLRDDSRPPLTRLLMGGVPSNIARIIQFATYIQELSDETNIQDKIDEYIRQERRCDLSFEHFIRLVFELKLAAIWKKRGLAVHFVPKQKKVTPDLEVASTNGKTYVECKRKDIHTKLSKELGDIYTRIIVGIQNEMSKLRLNYSVKVTLDKEAKIEDINSVISIAHENLVKRTEHFRESRGLIIVEGIQLASYDKIHSSKEIPEEPSGPTLYDYDYYFECQIHPIPIHDFLNLRKSDLPIRNFRVVSVYSVFAPTILQSVMYSIRDASTQLLESSGYGVVAIEISFGRTKSAETQIKQVLDNLPVLLTNMPHVSAVLIFLEETFGEAGKTHIATRCLRNFNPLTSHKLPQDIELAMKTDVSIPHKSLLD